jgi:hypothetical protein
MLEHLEEELGLCRRFETPMYFLGVGVNDAAAVRDARAVAVLQAAEHIWTRDARSAEMIREVARKGRVTTSADLAHVALAAYPALLRDAQVCGFVLNFEDRTQYDAGVMGQLPRIVAEGWAARWLVQEVRALPGSEQVHYSEFADDVRARCELCVPEYSARSVVEMLDRWGVPEVVVTSRYHAAILAAWVGARVLLIRRSEKMRALEEQVGLRGVDGVHDLDVIRAGVETCTAATPEVLESLAGQARVSCQAFLQAARAEREKRLAMGKRGVGGSEVERIDGVFAEMTVQNQKQDEAIAAVNETLARMSEHNKARDEAIAELHQRTVDLQQKLTLQASFIEDLRRRGLRIPARIDRLLRGDR